MTPRIVLARVRSGSVVARSAVLASLLFGCGAHPSTLPPGRAGAVAEDKNPAYLLAYGKRFAAIGDDVRAEQYLAAAIASGADEREVMPTLLHACVAAHHYRLAIDYADAALARHPNDARLRFLTGALHVSVGEPDRARGFLEEAARELKDDADVQFSVAVYFRDDMDDKGAADPYFREYLRLSPQGSHAEEARVSLMVRVR